MTKWLKRIGFVAAVLFLVLTGVNASWLASAPQGAVKLIAHGGLGQEFDRTDADDGTCTAAQIAPPIHDYLANTHRGTYQAGMLSAHVIEVDIATTADGKIAIFGDPQLDCRTDGTGPVGDATMAELKALDIGYGYTADGGETYPFRGQGVGEMPELTDLIGDLPRITRILYHLGSPDPAQADLLADALLAAGRDPADSRDVFYGDPAAIARIRQRFPEAWSWNLAAVRECTGDYLALGWTGMVPSSCENGTLIIPLDSQWRYWGWPNRLVARMESVGARVIVTGPEQADGMMTGLTLPEQVEQVPASFNGYIWVEDAWTIAPALYPSRDNRTQDQRDAAKEALDRRRAAN